MTRDSDWQRHEAEARIQEVLDAAKARGTQRLIDTDGSWKQRRAGGWVPGQLSRNDEGVGYVEKIDAAQSIPEWNSPAYDDSGWAQAVVIGPHPTPP